jgi:hypothetical protein
MQHIVLGKIDTRLDRDRLISQLRVKGRGRLMGELLDYIESVEQRAQPKAIILPVTVQPKGGDFVIINGFEFHSRVLRVNLEKAVLAFAVVATAGHELEEWAKTIDDLLYRYWADHLSEAVLSVAVDFAETEIRRRFALKTVSWMTPGSLDDWPLFEQKKLFSLVGKEAADIGVSLSESIVMRPLKSLSGIVFPATEKFYSCQLCKKETCLKRRAPYDSKLLWDKFKLSEQE